MKRSPTKANRMEIWADNNSDHLSSNARKKRKRQVSKKRRARLKAEDSRQFDQL